MKKVIQTAGRDILGEFAPDFAHFNDDILFGENWNNQDINLKIRTMITVTTLITSGIADSSLKYHLLNAKKNGVSRKEIAAILTHIAFYAGWPKAWAAFNLAKEVWNDNETSKVDYNLSLERHQTSMIFPIGEYNETYAKYFTGKSYLSTISKGAINIFNVTFEPKCRNNWHIHKAKEGGDQILICVAGRGYYQEWGKNAVEMKAGDVVNIPAGVKHWHGAANDSWFSHLAIEVPGIETSNEWLERVNDEEYNKLK